MFMPATTPNSLSKALLVNANTAKPIAAAMLQNSVTIPIRPVMVTKASCLSLDSLYAV